VPGTEAPVLELVEDITIVCGVDGTVVATIVMLPLIDAEPVILNPIY
jgi:hypothetical protein